MSLSGQVAMGRSGVDIEGHVPAFPTDALWAVAAPPHCLPESILPVTYCAMTPYVLADKPDGGLGLQNTLAVPVCRGCARKQVAVYPGPSRSRSAVCVIRTRFARSGWVGARLRRGAPHSFPGLAAGVRLAGCHAEPVSFAENGDCHSGSHSGSTEGRKMSLSLRRFNGRVLLCGFVAALIGIAAASASAQWTVINLHPAGTVASAANGVSSGQQVGYAQVGPTVGHYRASLWSGSTGTWVDLHPTGMGYSIAHGADGGQQVGEYYPAGFPRAALWSGSAGSWVDLNPAGSSQSSVFGVRDGQQVGNTYVGYYRAALWSGSAASWVDLNPPPTGGYTHTSQAYAVDGGHQVGFVVDVGGVISASLWSGSAASWVSLHPAGNISSWAYGVDGGQQVGVVRLPDTTSHAALWHGSAAFWVDLHPAGASSSRASDAEGGRQVGYAYIGGIQHASLWSGTAASWVDLNLFLPAGFVSAEAKSIATDGANDYIAGWGYNGLTQRSEALMWIGAAAAPCPGDIDHDRDVDLADLTLFAGCTAGARNAEFRGVRSGGLRRG